LADEVAAGRFREDLFYRINVMSLEMPPLRERRGDIPLLVERFLGEGWSLDAEALQAVERYNWPGNIRQLNNAIERAKIMAEDHVVQLHDLPSELTGPSTGELSGIRSASDDLADIERAHIVEVLNREGGNKARTARVLGINRRSLYRLIDKYEISTAREARKFG
jgi:DNA-binding NtrC family response regulator